MDSPSEADVGLRNALAAVTAENAQLYKHLTDTQNRCNQLLDAARKLRQQIIDSGGDPDPL